MLFPAGGRRSCPGSDTIPTPAPAGPFSARLPEATLAVSPSATPRKIIIDVDPGIDDAVVLAMALFDPRLEVVAVTATGGNVPPTQATANLQALVAFLDPPRLPRLGVALADVPLPVRDSTVHGLDGLAGIDLPRVPLHGGHTSDKVIAECLRAHPREITVLTLGPLTNISRLIQRDATAAELMGDLVICGGTRQAAGSATPVADWNFYCDPVAARQVIREPITKTLVPLETTAQLLLDFGFLDELPGEESRVGRLVRPLLAHSFRAHRQLLGSEGIWLHDAVAFVAATNSELFERETVAADVETSGELTAGMLVVDRRQVREWRPNVDMLVGCDVAAVQDCILRALAASAEQS